MGEDGRHLRTPSVTLDVRTRRVRVGGSAVALSGRERLVLAYLMRRPGDVCTRQEILSEVWGVADAQNISLVDVYVARLRAKLPPEVIATVRNAGYAFRAA